MKNFIALTAALLVGAASALAQTGDPLPSVNHVLYGPFQSGTTPNNGTNEVQTLTLSSLTTSGTFRVNFAGSNAIVVMSGTETDASAATRFLTPIAALATIGGTSNFGLGVSGTTPATITGTFTGGQGVLNVPQWVPSIVSGSATLTGTTTTPGVTADGRTSAPGATCLDIGDRTMFQNRSTVLLSPTWSKISSE